MTFLSPSVRRPDLAAVVAESLVGANLAGHDSHGVQNLPGYLNAARNGRLQPAARPRVTRREGSHSGDRWRLGLGPARRPDDDGDRDRACGGLRRLRRRHSAMQPYWSRW